MCVSVRDILHWKNSAESLVAFLVMLSALCFAYVPNSKEFLCLQSYIMLHAVTIGTLHNVHVYIVLLMQSNYTALAILFLLFYTAILVALVIFRSSCTVCGMAGSFNSYSSLLS